VFWWRDDDATAVTPELERLLALAGASGVPLALAVIPVTAQPGLFARLQGKVDVLQHGADHVNRAAAGEKKTEFPERERAAEALARLAKAAERLRGLAGARALPVLAPPWNRFRADLLAGLPSIGLRGLSAYGARTAAAVPGLQQVNTHVDIVAWQAGRGFIGEARALEGAVNCFTRGEPVGWLTHHAVHDAAAWRFLERLFSIRGARWASAAELFSYNRPAHV
jgi:hypothetical protein